MVVYANVLSSDGSEGVEVGQAVVPLTTFLPLIGTRESVSQWINVVSEKDKVHFSLRTFCVSDCRSDHARLLSG